MVRIRTFRPEDSEKVRDLFAQGQRDFAAGLEAEVEAYIRRSLDADLAHIHTTYLTNEGSHFWVAEIGDRVVGMVALQWLGHEEGELRRMCVASDARRQGVGRKLLETVEAFCRGKGYHRIVLSTVTQLQPAIAMYRGAGFRVVHEEAYGSMTVQYYVKDLEDYVTDLDAAQFIPGDAQS